MMKKWNYKPSPWLGKSLREKVRAFPREKDILHSILRFMYNGIVRFLLRGYCRLSYVGKKHLPSDQSFIIVSNHSSHFDSASLRGGLSLFKMNRIYSVAAKDYFFSSTSLAFIAAVMVNSIPFDRFEKMREGIKYCIQTLKKKESVLILFPEGTRSVDGKLQEFKSGIGLIVAGTEIPVIPAYIEGAHRAIPKGKVFPRPKKIRVTFGAPIVFKDVSRNKEGFRKVAKKLEEEIRTMGRKCEI